MQAFDQSESKLCLSCLGLSQSYCYCSALADGQSISIDFISINQLEPFSFNYQQDQPAQVQSAISHGNMEVDNKNNMEDLYNDYCKDVPSTIIAEEADLILPLPPLEVAPEVSPVTAVGSRSKTNDNVAHKRVTKFLQDSYREVTKEKVPADIKKFYFREDYSLKIWTLLEKRGKLETSFTHFENSMNLFAAKIKREFIKQPQYLSHLEVLIGRYLVAFTLFKEGEIEKSLKTVYDYENMRQRRNYVRAEAALLEMRQNMGLP